MFRQAAHKACLLAGLFFADQSFAAEYAAKHSGNSDQPPHTHARRIPTGFRRQDSLYHKTR